jgi:glycosyltransferase involved in cell wall biosynthesis
LSKSIQTIELLNCYDENTFHYKPGKKLNKPFKLISVGSLNTNKNQIFQLKVIKELIKRGEKFHLTIIGDGPTKNLLKQKAVEFDITPYISFLGSTPSPEQPLSECDLFIHTTIKEGFGLVIIEAMACGLPVISLDGGGNKFLVKNDFNGFISQTNIASFCDKIERALDKNIYFNLQENAIKQAEEYQSKNYSKKLLKTYNQLIDS